MTSSLQVPRRARRAHRSRLRRAAAVALAVGLVGGWLTWFVLTPAELPISQRTAEVTGVAGTPVYVGVVTLGGGRTLHVSEVDVPVEGAIEAVPVTCRGGSVGVTTDPTGYCTEVEDDAEGRLAAGDSIMLRLDADGPTEATIGRIEVTFREGLQWGSHEAGIAGATVTFAEQPAPAPLLSAPEDEEPTGRPGDDGQSPRRDSSTAARSAASVISSASIALVRWNHESASRSRPACSRVSA